MSEIIVRVAIDSDSDAVLKFLRESYYPEEPLTISIEPKEHAIEDEEFNMDCIKYGTCVIAYYENENNDNLNHHKLQNEKDNQNKKPNINQHEKLNNPTDVNSNNSSDMNIQKETNNENNIQELLGVLIAGPKYIGEVDHLIELSNTVKNEKWSKMLKLLAYLELKSNVFQHFNCESALHCHALAVHPNARGKSIGLKMLKKFINISKKLQFPVVTADCTSIYSIKLFEKLNNMECLNEMKFSDYHNDHGEQVFRPPSPHNLIKSFGLKINNDVDINDD